MRYTRLGNTGLIVSRLSLSDLWQLSFDTCDFQS